MHQSQRAQRSADIERLASILRGRRVVALTGAGCSTESGIPDYRGPEASKKTRNPIQGPAFIANAELRRRYWARAVIGWQRFRQAAPNLAHRALAACEERGLLSGVITQNVDGLHQAAGSRRVVELHGSLSEVSCLDCGAIEAREALQARLLSLNPGVLSLAAEAAPDGDADLLSADVERFQLAACQRCDGPLKPRVVFFGETVPRPVVEDAFSLLDDAEVLLVVGTSLAVFSGYRFVLRAEQRGMPIAIVNMGEVRGESLASVKVDGAAGQVLPALFDALQLGK